MAQPGPALTGGDWQQTLPCPARAPPTPFAPAACGQLGPPNDMLQNPHQEDNYPVIILYSRFATSFSQAKEADVLA